MKTTLIFLLGLVVGLLAYFGYTQYQKSRVILPILNTQTDLIKNNIPEKLDDFQNNDLEYKTINELGVKYPITEANKNYYYKYPYFFFKPELNENSKWSSCQLFSVSSSKTYDKDGYQGYASVKNLGNKYIFLNGPQSPCFENGLMIDEEGNKIVGTRMEEVKKLFNTLESI